MAVGQSIHPAMTLRHREQARSYKCCYRPSSVGAGLPAMAVGQSIYPAMTLRHREASSLLQMLLSPLLCGSWLASDGGGSVNISGNDITPSRGKLAPTNASIAPPLWELACQRSVGQSIHPALTLRHREQAGSYKCCYRPSSVGAGLPAMAVGQSIHPAMTLRHREASSLLQMLLSPLLCGSWLASDR